MMRTAVGKVMWVGRATIFLLGLAVILALVFGVASKALGADGDAFLLGKRNLASAISTLVKQGPGPALSLRVEGGQPPLKVNSSREVANLNADKVDGQDASAFAGASHEHAGEDITSGTVAEDRIDAAITRDGEVVPAVAANDGPNSGFDADFLDGKDSSHFQPSNPCPSGTLFHEGACIETTKRSSGAPAFPNAEGTCLQAGRRLPTVAELQTFRLRQGHDFNTAEYTSHTWTDTNGSTQNQKVMLVDPSTGAQSAATASAAFRCVAAPNVAAPNEAWEAEAQSDLRNAAAAASACAAANDGSYATCGSVAELWPFGFEKSPDVTYVNLEATATRWVSATQHAEGGSAYRFDTVTGVIEPVPRF